MSVKAPKDFKSYEEQSMDFLHAVSQEHKSFFELTAPRQEVEKNCAEDMFTFLEREVITLEVNVSRLKRRNPEGEHTQCSKEDDFSVDLLVEMFS